MDINAIPKDVGLDADHWARLIREQGLCIYDGNKGARPWFTNPSKVEIFDWSQAPPVEKYEGLTTEKIEKILNEVFK